LNRLCVISWRLASPSKSTTNETRAATLPEGVRERHKLPVLLNYYAAHTGRPGGGNKMNMLNLKRGSELRRSILAPKGTSRCGRLRSDRSARGDDGSAGSTTRWTSSGSYDQKKGRDPYAIFAERDLWLRPSIKQKHPKERFVGKVAKLSLQYQAGPPRFQTMMALGALGGEPMFLELDGGAAHRLHVSQAPQHDRGRRGIHLHRHHRTTWCAGAMGEWGVRSSGRRSASTSPTACASSIPVSGSTSTRRARDWTYLRKGAPSKMYGGLLFENIVQALANVIITEQMVKIAEKYGASSP
jgi:DNA polymerase